MNIQHLSFEKIPLEKLSEKVARRYVYGEKSMLARFELKKGAIIPKHQHANEQVTYILQGAVKVTFEDREVIVQAGEVLIIPSNIPHQFEALEDTIDFDVFTPPREDWIQGTDHYLKNS